jgi:NAD(P)-dependent dehydrogenase (short-subunit alcohol dehydrogenase family)
VHIGSIGGRISAPGIAPYNATKHALEAFAEAERHEFARSGTPIKVSLVEPGEIATAIWDKADTATDQVERSLDDPGRRRYGWLLDQTRGFIDEGREKGIPASKVADVVEQALTATKPKARYLVGQDAKVTGHVITRLPDRLRDAATRFNSSLWEKRGRKLSDSK